MIKKALLIILFALGSNAIAMNQPPSLSNGSAGLMSITDEQVYGKAFMQMVRQRLPQIHDLIALDYVDNLAYSLASHSPRPNYQFNFFIVKDPQINAFAGPGGNIGINSGLILAVAGEDELAAVIAHEIGHVVQRHFARNMAQQKILGISSIAAMVAAIAVGIASPSAGAGALLATQAGTAQVGLKYSRQFEKEADHVGFTILKRSGYPTSGMTKMLKSLMSEHYGSGHEQEFLEPLMSHPSAAYRAAESFDILAKEAPIKNNSSKLFKLVQARLTVDANNNPKALAKYEATLLHNPKDNNQEILNYAYALALLQSGQLSKAQKIIDKLVAKNPNELLYQIARANILTVNKKNQAAVQLLAKLYEENQDYYPLIMYYAHQLLQTKQAKKALSILKIYHGEFKHKPSYLSLLIMAQYKTGNHAESDLTRSKLYIIMGQLFKARAILDIAAKQATDPIIRAKIAREQLNIEKQIKTKKRVL